MARRQDLVVEPCGSSRFDRPCCGAPRTPGAPAMAGARPEYGFTCRSSSPPGTTCRMIAHEHAGFGSGRALNDLAANHLREVPRRPARDVADASGEDHPGPGRQLHAHRRLHPTCEPTGFQPVERRFQELEMTLPSIPPSRSGRAAKGRRTERMPGRPISRPRGWPGMASRSGSLPPGGSRDGSRSGSDRPGSPRRSRRAIGSGATRPMRPRRGRSARPGRRPP